MIKSILLLALTAGLHSPIAANADVFYKQQVIGVIKNGVYVVKGLYENDDGYKVAVYSFLDCPNATTTYLDRNVEKFKTRSLHGKGRDKYLARICLKRYGEPGIQRNEI